MNANAGKKIGGFGHLTEDVRDKMVANLMEAIGNLEALECPDLGELAQACDLIGQKLRTEMVAAGGQGAAGLLMCAKIIIDRANHRAG